MKFTEAQLKLLRDSWTDLKAIGLKELGLLIFHRLFNDSPEIRVLFYALELAEGEELTLDTMRKNPNIVSHATRIATNISKFVAVIDNTEELEKLTIRLGEIHRNKKVDPEYFEYLAPVLLAVFGNQLQLPSNSPILQVWIKAYGVLRNGIVKAM